MKSTYRNVFFAVGCLAVVVMLLTMDVTLADVRSALLQISYRFPLLVALWMLIYMMNAYAWYIILNSGFPERRISYMPVYKFTVTSFALNAVTPMGLMGGEPYRIMETMPYVGVEKASSSVVLYVMMHIFSHFCFWLFSVLLYLVFYFDSVNYYIGGVLLVAVLVCCAGIYFFMRGYKSGMLLKLFRGLGRISLLEKRVARFLEKNEEKLRTADALIVDLHESHKKVFYTSLFTEFLARVVSCAEIWVILTVFVDEVSYVDCIIVLAFTSLFANAMFFLPLQLGAREGGFAMVVKGLSFPFAYGVFLGLIIRLRELVCICIGLALMKVGNRKVPVASDSSVA